MGFALVVIWRVEASPAGTRHGSGWQVKAAGIALVQAGGAGVDVGTIQRLTPGTSSGQILFQELFKHG